MSLSFAQLISSLLPFFSSFSSQQTNSFWFTWLCRVRGFFDEIFFIRVPKSCQGKVKCLFFSLSLSRLEYWAWNSSFGKENSYLFLFFERRKVHPKTWNKNIVLSMKTMASCAAFFFFRLCKSSAQKQQPTDSSAIAHEKKQRKKSRSVALFQKIKICLSVAAAATASMTYFYSVWQKEIFGSVRCLVVFFR